MNVFLFCDVFLLKRVISSHNSCVRHPFRILSHSLLISKTACITPYLKITIFLAQLVQKWWGPHYPITLSFQKLFTLWKYLMFCLTYECFSIFCDAFSLTSVISSQNSCVWPLQLCVGSTKCFSSVLKVLVIKNCFCHNYF